MGGRCKEIFRSYQGNFSESLQPLINISFPKIAIPIQIHILPTGIQYFPDSTAEWGGGERGGCYTLHTPSLQRRPWVLSNCVRLHDWLMDLLPKEQNFDLKYWWLFSESGINFPCVNLVPRAFELTSCWWRPWHRLTFYTPNFGVWIN